MEPKNPRTERSPDVELPDEIVERLRRVAGAPAAADAATDRAVLERARAHFAARPAAPRRRGGLRGYGLAGWSVRRGSGNRAGRDRRRGRWAAGLTAAAVAFAAFLVVQPVDLPWRVNPDDVDRSGRVDILDAFALARMRAAGGSITETEIDALAERIVSLEPGRRAR